MRKIKSRKGFTLVELIVTLAILTIVLGLGTGAFIMVLQNYGTASSTESEQERATQIENYIIESARTAKDIKFIKSQSDGEVSNDALLHTEAIPTDTGTYVYSGGNSSIVEIYDYDVLEDESSTTTSESPEKSSIINVSGVKKLTFSLKRQKMSKTDTTSDKKFFYLYYTIEMLHGYTVNGSVVMNNLKDDQKYRNRISTTSSVDNIFSFDICNYDEDVSTTVSNKAVLFVKS